MQDFKELIIKRPQVYRMPKLPLNGKWLNEYGFTIGTLVSVSYYDSCLTLTANSNESNSSVIVVESKQVRRRIRPQLLVDGFMLKRMGIGVGDRVGLHIMPSRIQLTKINRYTTA